MRRSVWFMAFGLLAAASLSAQEPFTGVIPGIKTGGSRNIKLLAHLPMDSIEKTSDITIEQELSRPYVYTGHRLVPSGIDIISIKDPAKPRIIYSWRIENAELHKGAGSLNPRPVEPPSGSRSANTKPSRSTTSPPRTATGSLNIGPAQTKV